MLTRPFHELVKRRSANDPEFAAALEQEKQPDTIADYVVIESLDPPSYFSNIPLRYVEFLEELSSSHYEEGNPTLLAKFAAQAEITLKRWFTTRTTLFDVVTYIPVMTVEEARSMPIEKLQNAQWEQELVWGGWRHELFMLFFNYGKYFNGWTLN